MTRCRCVGTRHTCGIQNTNPNVVVVGQGGPKGVQGATGAQGPAGTGAQGVQGIQGLIGPGGGAQGTTGAQGATGTQGAAGTQGSTGAQGAVGSQGVQGTNGGGVTLQQLSDAIAGSALGSTDDLAEGATNKYFTVARVSYIHTQGVSSSTWTVNHNLGFYPNLTVQDSAGTIYEGEINYTNLDSLTVTFSSAFSGKAYLS